VKQGRGKVYQTHEFAELAGVTVRTLHHYDRVGLLKPSGRTHAGYRLYGGRDLARLEQIVVLKFLGLSLKQIGGLLDGRVPNLHGVLRSQRRALEEKRRRLDVAIRAVADAERAMAPGRAPDWQIFKNLIKVIEMQNNTEWMMHYYSDEARAKVEERKKLWSPELQEKVSRQWADLIGDVEGALNEDPAGPRAQALAERWRKLVEGFTGGDPQIQAGLNSMYADRKNWPAGFPKPYSEGVQAFMIKALKARRNS
jgi:MerR family transcriptional regulator, thiopeptide resistance regulator